jgi:hypothetical protein
MHFNLLLPSLIRADWERIGARLAPAVEVDPSRDLNVVFDGLMEGVFSLFDLELHAIDLLVVIEFADDGTCHLHYAAGSIGGKPREWLGRARLLILLLEQLARRHGCNELRLGGRDWSRIFPRYERGEMPNELVGAL